jgi:spore coat protein U-like protein
MKPRFRPGALDVALLIGLLCGAPSAQAVISCAALVSSISQFYTPVNPTGLTTTGTWSVNCTRALTDPNSVTFDLEANNGINFSGQQRRVAFGGSTYDYDLYRTGTIAVNQRWSTAPNRQIAGTVSFGSVTSGSASGMYWLNVPGGQTVGPAGVYTDLVGTTLTYNGGIVSLGTFSISITSITNCTLTAPPSLAFNYTSFQGAAATPSANFSINCTTGLPYTIALDNTGPITDNAVNLTYSLGLSAAGGAGTGVNQTYQVTGTMAGGQSGVCATLPCNNSLATNKTRTITVTY